MEQLPFEVVSSREVFPNDWGTRTEKPGIWGNASTNLRSPGQGQRPWQKVALDPVPETGGCRERDRSQVDLSYWLGKYQLGWLARKICSDVLYLVMGV